jgi:hypothetical protein
MTKKNARKWLGDSLLFQDIETGEVFRVASLPWDRLKAIREADRKGLSDSSTSYYEELSYEIYHAAARRVGLPHSELALYGESPEKSFLSKYSFLNEESDENLLKGIAVTDFGPLPKSPPEQ